MTISNLIEWTREYVKYKDIVHRRIEKIEEKENKILVHLKTGTVKTYICMYDLKSLDSKTLKDEVVVTLNRKDNFAWLLNNWENLHQTQVMFHFVNLEKTESWAINPHLHQSIADKESLKPGLISLFESVPEAK